MRIFTHIPISQGPLMRQQESHYVIHAGQYDFAETCVFIKQLPSPIMCHFILNMKPLFSYVTRSFCRVPYQWLSLAPSSTRRTNLCRFIVRFCVIRSFSPLFPHCVRLSRLQHLKKVSPITFPSADSFQTNLRVRSNSTQIIFT